MITWHIDNLDECAPDTITIRTYNPPEADVPQIPIFTNPGHMQSYISGNITTRPLYVVEEDVQKLKAFVAKNRFSAFGLLEMALGARHQINYAHLSANGDSIVYRYSTIKEDI